MSIAARRTMLLRILGVVAGGPSAAMIFTSACGGQSSPSPSDAGTATSSSVEASGAPAPFPSATVTAPTYGPPADCVTAFHPGYPAYCEDADAGEGVAVCFPLPEAGTCEGTYRDECIRWGYEFGRVRPGDSVLCKLPVADACCWSVGGGRAVGRPFVIDGKAVLAGTVSSDAWSIPELAAMARSLAISLETRTRAAIAQVWEREALAEHASVASFAKFALELLAVGAPPELLVGAQRAMGDEIEHAKRCFALASAYAESPRGPGLLDVAGALGGAIDLADFAARTASEGCIAETVAALQLHAAADAARDPMLTAMLKKTAEEEDEHALLAWRTVRWAIEAGGMRVRDAVRDVFAHASSHVGFGPCAMDDVDADVLRAHGVLSRRERHDLALAALASVIAPAAEQLLGPASPIATRAPGVARAT